MRVCYFGTYRANYSRNQIMIEALRQNGVEVIECHEPLWQGIEDRVQVASGRWLSPSFVVRVARAYWRLFWAYWRVKEHDVVVLGYPSQMDAYLARVLTWLRRKPLVMDVFMSIYLIAQERGLTARHRISGQLIFWVEKMALLLPDLLIQDTAEYVEWFHKVYGLQPDRFRLVPTGADNRAFCAVRANGHDDGTFRVLYYGTFIPNHGVDQIVEAARLLKDQPDIHFELIGDGPTKPRAVTLSEQYSLENVTFVDWVDKEMLPLKAAQADLFLGAFGITPQSLMTVQNKIYEGLAMRRPVLTGDSLTLRASLIDRQHVYLVPRGEPAALAAAILDLKAKPVLRERLAAEGYELFQSRFTPMALGAALARYLHEVNRQ